MTETKFQFLWRERSVAKDFRAGVSLHSHTSYSEEGLDIIPRYTARVPYLGKAIRQEEWKHNEANEDQLDFGRAFWTPPLTPSEAYRLEESQIQNQFQLPGFVSLSDHDDIRAGSHLHMLDEFSNVPISVEWTIPFGPTFFHLGVHNLPVAAGPTVMEELVKFTADPQETALSGVLAMLNSFPDVLLILNHPLWDEKGIGIPEHAQVLGRLLERHGRSFHALELNGLRSWRENQQTIWLGRQSDLPVISGGDRHGCEPNAILNLTHAETFAEFIHEIRYRRKSHVVFMPQYREPLRLRILQTIVDIVREYPENFEGRRLWSDRVFYRRGLPQQPVPLSSILKKGGPRVVKHFIAAMRLVERRSVRSALRLALNDRSTVDLEVTV